MSTLVTASSVAVTLAGRKVLHDGSLALSRGEMVALIGPNGCGKTTLLRALLGHVAITGAVTWFDKPLAQWRPRDLAQRVAYLPQTPAYEPGDRVIDALRLGRSPHQSLLGLETEHDDSVVHDVAQSLGLTELLDRPLDTLSGGQRQRVFLGRALAQEPQALLLDEPATYLDLRHQVDLYQLLGRLRRDRELGILIAAHDLNLVAMHCDRAVVLKDGRVVASGSVAESMTEQTLFDAFEVRMKRIVAEGVTNFVPIT